MPNYRAARLHVYMPTCLFKTDDIPLTAVRDKRPAVGPVAATDHIDVADICEPARCPRRTHERCPAARDREATTIGPDDAGRVIVCILFDCYLHEVHPISDHSFPYRRNYPTPAATRALFITAPSHISECVGGSCLGGISATPLQSYTHTRLHTQHDSRAAGTVHPLIRLKSGMAGRRIVISVPPCAAAAPATGYLPTSLPFRSDSRLQGYIATKPTGTQVDAIFREFDTSGWNVLIAAAARPERRHVVCRMVAGLAKPPIGRSTSICANTRPRARK